MISRDEMLAKLEDYHDRIYNLIMASVIPDKKIFEEMCCSPYSEDEWPGFKVIVESASYGVQQFTYRDFTFKITGVIDEERFVCWIEERESSGYLENVYLVPGAWIWGRHVNEQDIERFFLPAIDKYLQEVGEDNIK